MSAAATTEKHSSTLVIRPPSGFGAERRDIYTTGIPPYNSSIATIAIGSQPEILAY